MNRKERRRQAKLGQVTAVKVPAAEAAGGFRATDALAFLGNARRPTVPLPTPASRPEPRPSEQDLFAGVYSRTLAALRGRRSPDTLAASAGAAAHDADSAWAARRPEVESRRSPAFACTTGCTWCCHQMVAAEPAEVIAIARHVETRFTAEARQALVERLTALDAQTRGLGIVARARLKLPCAFLVEGKCSIYDARPLRCRGVYSRDAGHCRWAMDNPDLYFGDYQRRQGPGPVPAEPGRIMNAAVVGLLEATKDFGLHSDTLELTAAARTVLETPNAAERFMAGEPVFAAAVLPEDDSPQPPNPPKTPADEARLAKPGDSS